MPKTTLRKRWPWFAVTLAVAGVLTLVALTVDTEVTRQKIYLNLSRSEEASNRADSVIRETSNGILELSKDTLALTDELLTIQKLFDEEGKALFSLRAQCGAAAELIEAKARSVVLQTSIGLERAKSDKLVKSVSALKAKADAVEALLFKTAAQRPSEPPVQASGGFATSVVAIGSAIGGLSAILLAWRADRRANIELRLKLAEALRARQA